MIWETLEVLRDGAIGWLIFNRPEAGNAIDSRMFLELEAAWHELESDDRVKAIVNTGNGRSFQTGLDVRQLAGDKDALRKSSRQTRDNELMLTGWHCGVTKPVIAAVNGVCAGGGLHFVADADIVIAAEPATFLDPHVSVGQVSALESISLLKKAPMGTITRMAFMGREERLGADRALQIGIVSEVVVDPTLRSRAQEIGELITRHDPALLAATKAALWARMERP